MGNGIRPGSLGIDHSFRDYIDTGTMCKALSPVPGSVGTHSNITVSNGSQTIFGNAYLFILADEILPSGKLVRKVIRVPNYTTASMIASTPELFGLRPNNILNSKVTIGEHALGNTNSRFISASANKSGAPNIKGRPVYIDIKKALASGVTIHSTDEIITDLDRIAKQQPNLVNRINRLKSVITTIEGETLIEGSIPKSAVKSQAAMQTTKYLRFVQVIGMALTVYDLGNATVKSVNQGSPDPIVAESIRQIGGWGGAIAGAKIGGIAGAVIGIETGPGAILTGAIGALIFGVAGYFGADWIADQIDEN